MPPTSDTRLVAGCMTGTSLDGLDAALVAITGHGLDMRASFIGMISRPLDELRDELRHFASGGAAEPIRYLRAARRLGELHAEAVAALCEQEGCKQLDFVVAHGQTIWHAPGDRGKNPPAEPVAEGKMDAGVSWQLFDPWPIVRQLRVSVCYDLRQADLIAGGQGAPITPIADWVLFHDSQQTRVIANLGGICNVTRLPAGGSVGDISGEDMGQCNLLIDGAVRLAYPNLTFDKNGELARRGDRLGILFHYALESPFFQHPRPRSTGREEFSEAWVRDLARRSEVNRDDLIPSAVDAVGRIILNSLKQDGSEELIAAGGGTKNSVLMEWLIQRSEGRVSIRTTDDLGIPCEAREAMGFAVLGALSQDGVPITLPQVTGGKSAGAGGGVGVSIKILDSRDPTGRGLRSPRAVGPRLGK